MIVLISPAKTFNIRPYSKGLTPYYNMEAQELIKSLKKLDKNTIIKKMKVSEKLATQIMEDYKNFGKTKNSAIFSYYGHQFKHFDVDSIATNQYDTIAQSLYILSGLYGILNAFDDISPYRLEMQDKTLFNLYDYWHDKIHKFIDTKHKGETIINLCSHEYGQLVDHLEQTITINFSQKIDNNYKIHSMEVKKLRGLFARHLMLNINDDLKSIAIDGYTFDEKLSDDHHYTYVKEITS